jgi:type I restriction enzyme, S subunit
VIYTPNLLLSARAREAEALLGERKAAVDRVLDLLAPLSTRQCGVYATAYAAWNDLLLEGKRPNDRDIIREARHHWHESKQDIADKTWFTAIRWLQQHALVPKGTGRRTGIVAPGVGP